MSVDIFLGLVLFALASSVTPGPNNLMLMASGVNHGFAKTLPHMFGVSLGFVLMAFLLGLGVLSFLFEHPRIFWTLKIACALYLLYLAFKIANAGKIDDQGHSKSKPFTFVQAVLFQWVNPKAWTMALTSISLYATDNSLVTLGLVVTIFGAVNFPCIATWTLVGTKLKYLLTNPRALKTFNYCMAFLLVLSLFPLFLHD